MKKYVSSFRLFFGRCSLTSMISFLAAMAAIILIVAVLEVFAAGGDFITGMKDGMSVMLAGVVPTTGIIFLSTVYTYANPATPGHKYYVSVPDSAEHFRRAIIAANLFSLALGALLIAVMNLIFLPMRVGGGMAFYGFVLILAVMGLCNFTGYIKNTAARIAVITSTMCFTGFAAGFLGADVDDEDSFSALIMDNPWLPWAVLGTAALVFAGGFVYSVAVSRKKWESGGKS